MIFIQFVSSFSGSYGPILGPYDLIDIDSDNIRLFNGSESADMIYWWDDGDGYYYDGIVYEYFRLMDDPRKGRNYRAALCGYDPNRAKKERNETQI
jgi:hypothetical protein